MQYSRRIALAVTAAAVAGLLPAGPANAAEQPFRYEIQGGTAAWSKLANHQQMVDAVQIPKKTAAKMSTERLVSTVLDYPLLPDALAFNNVQHGLEVVASRFNGLAELFRRKDAGTVLLKRYRTFDARVRPTDGLLAAGNRSLQAWKLEALLAQPQVLATLRAQQLESLLHLGLAKHEAKTADVATYGQAGLEPTGVLLGRALAKREGWDYQQSQLLRDAVQVRGSSVGSVVAAVRQHLAEPSVKHKVTDGVTTMDYGSYVYTPRGSAVSVITMTYELTSAQIASYDNWVRTYYPGATLERSASRKYNCHSYAWYSTSPWNDRWMNTPGDDKYWQDGSYRWWHPPMARYANMKVSYVNGDHSGIWVGSSNYVRSKWGQYGQVYHAWNYAPYNSSSINSYFP